MLGHYIGIGMEDPHMHHQSPSQLPNPPTTPTVMNQDTRLGNQSCDRLGDLSPTFSKFVYVCLCLFTYVWSLDLLWKLYIVPMLRELTSLSFNISHDTLILSLSV